MTIIAFIITGAWILAAIIYGIICHDLFLVLKPNELGDFFACVFAPVAFFWLVIGYIQHGQQIKQNTEELARQQKAMLEMIELEKQKIGRLGELGSDIFYSGSSGR